MSLPGPTKGKPVVDKPARVKARGKVIRIPLRDRTGGVVAHALVDDDDYERLLSHANTSGYRGVTRERGRWKAKSVLDGRTHHIGYYATAEEAGRAAASWRAAHMPFSVEASLPMKSDRLPLEETIAA